MDKPKGGNTIKIKLNGETQEYHEEPKKMEPEDSLKQTTRVIKIDSNRIDSDVFSETAAAKEPIDESFDWIIPESSENEIEEYKITSSKTPKKSSLPKITSFSSKSNNNKKSGRPLGSIVISGIFAILIGTTIGVVMLKLVISGPTDKKAVTDTPVVEEKGDTENKPATGKTTSTAISPLTSNVIQGGKYTSKDGAKEALNELKSKGIPSQIVEIDGNQFIFLGIADSIETAKSLSTQYKERGVEGAFAKALSLDEKKVSDITNKEKVFLDEVPTIYQTLSAATSGALLTKTIPEDAAKAIGSIDEQLKVSGIKNEKVKSLKAELSSAEEKVKAFQKSKDTKSLNEAQQHLLNFLSAYYSL
ncbi:hypothetical protein BABA_18227 [Neobacillus bataviensis LMG 21833]|uniref:Stage II sporulation protein B n=1 Tax=Neobacillus bataviensis LMG 21833 TaxID=1117379 RepID=K6DCR0_9BACI|nr:hypothetical protein [Neobacillus bataviensis]EKN65858.1 hypothetical protein BABA_18227 [Neobacillus bataviensis LMG 21833]